MSSKTLANQWLQILRDLLFVLRGLWLLLLINLLALFAFLLIPQGTDMLLSILEPKTFLTNTASIFFIVISLFCWSVSSEYCSRFLIYMTDNSGHSLSIERIVLRKYIQKLLAGFFLYYPSALVLIAFMKAFFQNFSDIGTSWWILTAIIFVIALLVRLLLYLYKTNRPRKNGRLFNWMHLSKAEIFWTSKLFGIFNNYRVDLHKADTAIFDGDLPREMVLPNGSIIPSAFVLLEGPMELPENKQVQVWIYRIPIKYYRNLITQLIALCILSTAMILFFSFTSIAIYQGVGAIALICFSFASWQVLYTLLHFLDKAQPIPKINLTFRLLVLIWLCFCSYINNDHPTRWIEKETTQIGQTPAEHFKTWIADISTTNNPEQVPVFFITSEGGALRTGAFTAVLLAKLQDSFPDFKKHIYCYSGVSGGSLGLQFFQSIPDNFTNLNTEKAQAFFATDYLSPVTGKLVFGEILNYFIPFHINAFDRAIALEQAWEISWQPLSENFDHQIGKNKPAIFINTVESETGLPSVWSNLLLDSSIPLASSRDLRNKYHLSIPYSTAINLGTRFPLVSPAGMIYWVRNNGDSIRMHYIDGGYFENKGQETILEMMQSLHLENYPQVKPYILQFNFSQDDSTNVNIRFANEWRDIINGIENTRYARVNLGNEALKQYMHKNFDEQQIISLNLDISEKKLPMNWLLSQTAMNRVNNYTDSLMHLKKDPLIMKKIYRAIANNKKQEL